MVNVLKEDIVDEVQIRSFDQLLSELSPTQKRWNNLPRGMHQWYFRGQGNSPNNIWNLML